MMRYDTVLRSLILTTALALAGTVVAAPAAHEAASCKQCHIGTSEAGGKAPNSRCTGCHGAAGRPADAGPDFGFHRDASRACVDCHSFHTPETVLTAAGPLGGAAAGDLDGDGDLDIVLAVRDLGSVHVIEASGGTLTQHSTLPVGGDLRGVDLADFDGDGALDIAIAAPAEGAVKLLISDP